MTTRARLTLQVDFTKLDPADRAAFLDAEDHVLSTVHAVAEIHCRKCNHLAADIFSTGARFWIVHYHRHAAVETALAERRTERPEDVRTALGTDMGKVWLDESIPELWTGRPELIASTADVGVDCPTHGTLPVPEGKLDAIIKAPPSKAARLRV